MRRTAFRTAGQAGALLLLVLLLSSPPLLAPGAAHAAAQGDEVWVLTETQANPTNARTEYYGGGQMPDWFGEPRFEGKFVKYSVSASGLGVEDRDVDNGIEYHSVSVRASLEQPPAQMVPGQTVELTASFSHGGSVQDGGIGVLFWYSGKGVRMEPESAFGYSPWAPEFDGTSSVTYRFVVPADYGGGELEIYASFWNAEPCLVVWKYRAATPGEPTPGTEATQEAAAEEPTPEPEGRRPVIVLPGIYGSFIASSWSYGTWLYSRGLDPGLLAIDPVGHYYDDLVATLRNVGYVDGQDLFIGAYDWRLPPGPFDGSYDGVIGNLSGASITDGLYEYGVDYLGYYLKLAAEQWRADHDGAALDSVDIIAHSTGGLVARVYIQSMAHGGHFRAADGEAVRLPRVNQLFMIAVPNRGAALPWQAMNNNFVRDAASKYFMSKLLAGSYHKVQNGSSVQGPPSAISPDSIRDPATGLADPVKFIRLYCPTFRSLLATYPFIQKPDGSLAGVNALPEQRNDLVLDLNNGLDLSDRQSPADPSPFAGAVGRTTVFFSTRKETAHQVREMNTAAEDALFPLDAYREQDAAAGTTWYQDIVETVGDGTVPSLSAAGQFAGDARVEAIEVIAGDVSHTGLVSNRRVQTAILTRLGVEWQGDEVSTGLAGTGLADLPGALVALSDPVGFLLVDGQGRRLGWTPDTGAVSEIPGGAWFGEGDGIGFVFGDMPQPLRVDLLGLGEYHTVLVTGEQAGQRVGLEDRAPLARGETRSLVVAAGTEPGEPASPAARASGSGRPAAPWLTGLVVALAVPVAGAALFLGLRRRRGGQNAPMRARPAPAPAPGPLEAAPPSEAAVACPACGAPMRRGTGFCSTCGAPAAAVTARPTKPEAHGQAESPAQGEAPAAGWLCAACGRANRQAASFCGVCGAARPPALSLTWTCSRCGQEVRAGARFCGECGGPTRSSAPSVN